MKMLYKFVVIIIIIIIIGSSSSSSSNRSNTSSNILLLLPFYFCVSLSISVFNQPINKVQKKCHAINLEADEDIK